MLGIIIVKPTVIFDYYISYCDNYIYKVLSVGSNPFSVLTGRCISHLLFLGVVCISSCIIFLFPLQIFAVFYRGFIFGIELVILCTCYSVSGIFVAILLIVPQSLIFGGILILAAPFSLECGLQTCRAHSIAPARSFLCWLAFFLALSFLSALLEFFTVVIIFRPFVLVL